MAKRFLTDINLKGNQLIESAFEKLTTANEPATNLFEGRMYFNTDLNLVRVYDGAKWVDASIAIVATDPTTELYEGRIIYNTTSNMIKSYDGAAWSSAGSVTDVQAGTDIDVTSVGSVFTVSLEAEIGSNTTGNAATATYATTAGTANAVAANSVALGTDTTGDYVASVSASDGIGATGTGEGAGVALTNTDKGSSQNIFKNVSDGTTSVVADTNDDTLTISGGTGITVTATALTDTISIANAGVTALAGTTDEVEVSASTGSVTIGLPNSVKITTDLTVGGDLTVNGTTTTLNTTELLVEDNIITLNAGVTGTPSLNAGVEVERGTADNVAIRWNETSDTWELTRDGTVYETITTSGTVAEEAQDAVGTILVDGTTVDFTYTDATPSITAEVKLATTSYLATTGGLAVDKSALETALSSDGYTKKYSANVGDTSATSIAVTHNLGTRDVQVQVYDNATYDTVECDVVRTSTSVVTVSFSVAPATDAYRVVVVG